MAKEEIKLRVEEKPIEPKAHFATSKNFPLKPTPHYIKYDGIFDWDGLYKMIYQWFMDRGYYFEEGTLKHKVPSPLGAEVEYAMDGWRKTTDYIKEWVSVAVHFYDMREVEVIKDGKKKKLMKGRFIMEIHGKVETDYQDRWTQSQFGQYLKEFYDKFLIKKDMENVWWDRLYYVMLKLQTEIKKYLDMENQENAYYDMW